MSEPSGIAILPVNHRLMRTLRGTLWVTALLLGIGCAREPAPPDPQLVVPGASCCYECYRRRRAAAGGFGDAWEVLDRTEPPALPAAATVLVAALAAQIALCALVDGVGVAVPAGVVWAIELVPEVAVSRHVVHRSPRCPVCSAAATLPPLLPWLAEGA